MLFVPATKACAGVRARCLILVLALAGCTGGASPSPSATVTTSSAKSSTAAPHVTPTAAPTKTLAPSAKAVKIFDSSLAACAIDEAYAGLSPIPRLPNCALPVGTSSPIPANSLVTTNACGEAWLDTGCGELYVFGGSNVRVSTCPESSATGSACVEYGSAAWYGHVCDQEVRIITPAGTIHLQGTWMSATYDPERRVALFVVFDGAGEAFPVLDDAGQRLGEATAVPAGRFWFTVPGDQPVEIAGLPSRQALPFDELPRIIAELHLETAFASIFRQASADGVDLSGVPDMPTLTVRLGGPQFGSSAAVDAVLRAYDWRETIGSILGRDDFTANVVVGTDPPRDLLPITRDAEAATNAMLEGKLFSALVTWSPTPELDKIASTYIDALKSLQYAEFQYFAATDGHARPEETPAAIWNEFVADSPVIWLDYRP